MTDGIHLDKKDGRMRFVFIAYFAAISFAREGVAALPYADFLHPTKKRTSANNYRKPNPSGACHLTIAQRQSTLHSAAKSKTDA